MGEAVAAKDWPLATIGDVYSTVLQSRATVTVVVPASGRTKALQEPARCRWPACCSAERTFRAVRDHESADGTRVRWRLRHRDSPRFGSWWVTNLSFPQKLWACLDPHTVASPGLGCLSGASFSPRHLAAVWRDDPRASEYLAELMKCSLSELEKTPAELQRKKDAVVKETENLAFANYNAFIQTATCSGDIFKDVCGYQREPLMIKSTESIPALPLDLPFAFDVMQSLTVGDAALSFG